MKQFTHLLASLKLRRSGSASVVLPVILLFFIFVPPAQAINLNGDWISQPEGATVKLTQSGDTFSLIVTDSRLAEFIGSTTVKGTITGDTFIGQVYYLADKCPKLNGFVPARGTISEGKIEVKYIGFEYDPDTCIKRPNSEIEHSNFYTRVITSSPTPQSKQSNPKGNEAKSQNTKPAGDYESPFSIFAFNPLETWRNIQGLLDIEEGFPSLLQSSQFLTLSAEAPLEIPRPSIAFDPEGQPWNFLPGYIPHESIYLGNTMRISKGTKISTGGVDQGSSKKLLNLEEGEVEVIRTESNVKDSEYDGIKTPNATVLSVQTHYWVSFDKKTGQTTVAVYEGKVEVKTNDGKTTTVSPNGDPSAGSGQSKPGVVVVAQKLSVTKLAVVGMILLAIVGGIFWFAKRKRLLKFSKKKSK